jgi:hypothetical protein
VVAAETPRREGSSARRRYVDDTVRVWLGLQRSSDADVPRLPARLERRFLRLEEYERPNRDAWDCWDHTFSENFQDGLLAVAEVDRWLRDRRAELRDSAALEPLWPRGKRFAVCLTHDVDVISPRSTAGQVLRHAAAGLDRGSMEGGPLRFARPPVRAARALRRGISRSPSTVSTLELSAELDRRYDGTASFFFTVPAGRDGSRYDCTYSFADTCTFRGARTTVADVARTLAHEGFDVGLHGSYYSAIRPGMLAAERAALARHTGIVATTTRQHFLHWSIRETPQLQHAAGFVADSTLGFNRTIGFRASTTLPFRHFDVAADRALELLEVPLAIEDSALLGKIGAAGDLERAQELVRALVDEVVEVGGALTLLWHPDKLLRPDWRALYEWVLEYVAERNGWLTSLAGLERWWIARERQVLGS